MSETRWDRLAADLAAAGVPATISTRSYTETRRGRAVNDTTRFIMLRHPQGGTVEVHDKWWAKNPDVWVGWQVHREDREGIELAHSGCSKKRGEVVAAVLTMLDRPAETPVACLAWRVGGHHKLYYTVRWANGSVHSTSTLPDLPIDTFPDADALVAALGTEAVKGR